MEALGLLWNEMVVRPMLNFLVLLYALLFQNFGLSILVFTVIIRGITMPLTLRQFRQTRAIAALQPKLQEIQKRYAKDREALSRETMRLYREHGINPLGCIWPFLVQFPIWIGLFQALLRTLPTQPDSLVGLSRDLYPWLPIVHQMVPLNSRFLWLDLARPDPTPVLPLLVGASMWVTQKMNTPPTLDPRQASTNNMLLWMMPLLFAFFTFQFPSGLALYWVVSNVLGVVIQYLVTGRGRLLSLSPFPQTPKPVNPELKEKEGDGQRGSRGEDPGRSHRGSPKAARRKARRGRNPGH